MAESREQRTRQERVDLVILSDKDQQPFAIRRVRGLSCFDRDFDR
jgi:hypothetical protein